MNLIIKSRSFSRYNRLSDLVDQMFPPLHRNEGSRSEIMTEYSCFTYWREPILDISDSEEELLNN